MWRRVAQPHLRQFRIGHEFTHKAQRTRDCERLSADALHLEHGQEVVAATLEQVVGQGSPPLIAPRHLIAEGAGEIAAPTEIEGCAAMEHRHGRGQTQCCLTSVKPEIL